MQIIIFEDYSCHRLYPLSLIRPVFLLRCGILSLLEKIIVNYPFYKCLFLMRKEIQNLFFQEKLFDFSVVNDKDEYLFISGQILLDKKLNIELNQVGIVKNEIVTFKLNGKQVKQLKEDFFFEKGKLKDIFEKWGLSFIELKNKKLKYLFDFVKENSNELINDFSKINDSLKKVQKLDSKNILGDENNLVIHDKAKVYPGVYFICEKGTIFIDEYAEIKPLSVIEGPCYIGKMSQVDGAKIGGGTSIHQGCKVGGEISSSVFLEYSNKQHDGFVGHSYVGSFVNFGALATASDLKNNYSTVSLNVGDEKVNTDSIKIGAFIGDHTKLGIGSLINTGTVIGLGCNLYFEGAMYPKEVPSFVWGGKYPFKEYEFTKLIANIKKVLKRRNKILKENEIKLFHKIFKREKEKRNIFLLSH